MREDRSGHVVLIAGGGRGMGGAIARELSANGYPVALMALSESCEKLARNIGWKYRQGILG